MTYSNGSEAPAQSAPDPEENGEKFSATSLDYWREMTQRQVERLQQKVKELEAEAAPLKQQISTLSNALHAIDRAAAPRQARQHRGPGGGPGMRSQVVSDADRAEITRLVLAGKSNRELRDALPHLPDKNLMNMAYIDRNKHGLKNPGLRS